MKINIKRKSVAAWLSGAALIGIVAGCGGGSNPRPSPTPTPAATPSATPTTNPTPVPGGNELLFVSLREVPGVARSYKLFASNLDGSNLTYIPASGVSSGSAPKWLPGRREILYTGFRNEIQTRSAGKTASTSPGPGVPRIRRVNRDGSGDRDLLALGSKSASVSADGRQIAYVVETNGRNKIFIADIDGANRRQISDGPDNNPSWSPDGTRLVFDSFDSKNNNFDLFTIGLDGKGRKRLTTSLQSDDSPQFSPDGKRVVYSSASPTMEGTNVFVINSDGTNPTQLTNNKNREFASSPKWTSDGRHIVFHVSDQFRSVSADNSGEVRLFDTPLEFYFDLR